MAIDGIGRGGSRSSRTQRSEQTQGPQQTQRPGSPRPTAGSNPAATLGDGFDARARDFSKLGGPSLEPGPANATATEGASEVMTALGGILHDSYMGDIRGILQDSPTGAAALQFMDENQIPVRFTYGGGSYWDGTQITLDANESPQIMALNLVHEINHAESTRNGTKPDPKALGRDAYVDAMLREETQGMVEGILAQRELEAQGHEFDVSFPLENVFSPAYERAMRETDSSLPAEEVQRRAVQAGFDAVLHAFYHDDKVTASTSPEGQAIHYPELYGTRWDTNNPPH